MRSCGFKSHLPQTKNNELSHLDLAHYFYMPRSPSNPWVRRSPRHICLVGPRRTNVHRTLCAPSSAKFGDLVGPCRTDVHRTSCTPSSAKFGDLVGPRRIDIPPDLFLHRCSHFDQISVGIIESYYTLSPAVCHQLIYIFCVGIEKFKFFYEPFYIGFFKI